MTTCRAGKMKLSQNCTESNLMTSPKWKLCCSYQTETHLSLSKTIGVINIFAKTLYDSSTIITSHKLNAER